MRLHRRDQLVLPSPLVLYGATEHDLKALFHGWRDRRLHVDMIWGDTVESTEDLTFVPRLLENWAELERWFRELLAKRDEEPTQNSPKRSKVDQREVVLTEWLVRMKDHGVPFDRLYFALLAEKIRRPNGREYSRGAIQHRVAKARARRKGGANSGAHPEVEDSAAIASLRLTLREIEMTKLAGWLACPATNC
jgi:hypothetical protein